MNHAQLRAFHAVAVTGSFTEAARRLRVSQPAVTMQVRALEESYGVELFVRRGRAVQRTELGDALAELTARLFGTEEAAAELLGAARALRKGRLRAGADAPYHVMPLLAAFHARHPGISVALSLGNARDVLADLTDGRTDVAVLAERGDDPRLFAVPFARYRVIVFVARGHPWAHRKRLALADLDGQPLVSREPASVTRRTFERALAGAGVAPRVVMELGSREAVREAVAAGLGAGVIAEAELGEDARFVPLPIEDPALPPGALENTESAVCLKARRDLRIVRAFFEVVPAPGARAAAATSPGPLRAASSPAGRSSRGAPRRDAPRR